MAAEALAATCGAPAQAAARENVITSWDDQARRFEIHARF